MWSFKPPAAIGTGSIRMRSKLGLPPRIHGAHPFGLCQRSTRGKIVLCLLLAMTIARFRLKLRQR
jgi:hypothetical protein